MKQEHAPSVYEEDRSDWRRGRYEPAEPPEADKAIDRNGASRDNLPAKPVRPRARRTN